MDLVISDSELNYKWWNSGYCPKIHLLEYELISRPRGVSLDRCINTKCHITTEVLWWCLTGKILPDGLLYQDHPISETLYIDCDYGAHSLILHNGKIYDSCWNAYYLNVRPIPSTMLNCIRHNKPFTLPCPDGTTYEVIEYGCYVPDVDITEHNIISNYNRL